MTNASAIQIDPEVAERYIAEASGYIQSQGMVLPVRVMRGVILRGLRDADTYARGRTPGRTLKSVQIAAERLAVSCGVLADAYGMTDHFWQYALIALLQHHNDRRWSVITDELVALAQGA